MYVVFASFTFKILKEIRKLELNTIYEIGVTNLELNTIASSIGSQFPCTYLGLPIGAKMTLWSNWNPIVERFLKRLSNWKAKSLSFGSRIILNY